MLTFSVAIDQLADAWIRGNLGYMTVKVGGPAKQAQSQMRQHRPSVPLNKVWW
jgi:hypothetical protein